MQLHITREGQQFGPYDLAQVNEMLAQGSLLPTDYAWYEGAADWTPLDQVPGITIPGAEPAPVEAIPVAAAANQSTPADAQPAAGAATATAGAAKKKKIFMIAGISVASVGAIVGALFAFGIIGGGEENGDTNGPKNNDGGGKPSANGNTQLPPPANRTVTYTGDIKPILEGNCYKCHNATQKVKGGLDMAKETLDGDGSMWEGDSGKVIDPKDSAKSLFVQRLTNKNDPMPPDETKMLSAEQVGLIRKWIDQGAKFD